MVLLEEKRKPNTKYKSPLSITEEMREFTNRRERRARELGIALYVLGDDPDRDDELQRLEDYIVENFLDFDLDVPEEIKEKYLSLKKRASDDKSS